MERVQGITSDRRFQKTELKIQQAIENQNITPNGDSLKVDELCQKARISRATFYRHYPSVRTALAVYRINRENEVNEHLLLKLSSAKPLVVNFYHILAYFHQQKNQLRSSNHRTRSIYTAQLLQGLRPLVRKEWRKNYPQLTTEERERLFVVFSHSLLCELEFWDQLENLNSMYLFEHAQRLGWIVNYLPLRRHDPIFPQKRGLVAKRHHRLGQQASDVGEPG